MILTILLTTELVSGFHTLYSAQIWFHLSHSYYNLSCFFSLLFKYIIKCGFFSDISLPFMYNKVHNDIEQLAVIQYRKQSVNPSM